MSLIRMLKEPCSITMPDRSSVCVCVREREIEKVDMVEMWQSFI